MKRILAGLLLLLIPELVLADDQHAVAGDADAERTVCLRDRADTQDFINSVSFTTGDCAASACCKVSIDGGAVADCDNQPVAVSEGCYVHVASAAELSGCETSYFYVDAAASPRFAAKVKRYEAYTGTGACHVEPEVDLVKIEGDAQSATDLKDLADAGYDPSTNKLQGLVLADTVTTLTNLPAVTSNWLTASGIADNAIDAGSLASDAGTELGTATWATGTRSITGLTATALQDFFDTSSTDVYGDAIAGSVVKEIADNAGGGGSGDFIISSGTAQSVTASPPKMRLDASATYANDALKDHAAVLVLTSSGNTAAVGQVLCIKTNASSNDEVTFTRPYKSLPSGTVTYAVIPAPNCNPANWPKNL